MKPEELAARDRRVPRRSASARRARSPPPSLANPGKLKIIGRAGVGVDNIDVKAATEKGVLVINTPQGNAAAAAELAIGLMFALARKIPQAAASMKAGRVGEEEVHGHRDRRQDAGRGRPRQHRAPAWPSARVGLKMNVIGYDPFPPKAAAGRASSWSRSTSSSRKSDFITLHVPLTAETKGLFDAATFAKMKKGVLPHQLRARRHRRRERGARGAQVGPARRRGARRVRQGAAASRHRCSRTRT